MRSVLSAISVHTDLPYVNALMHTGANSYVTKNSSGEEMIRAILLVMEGNSTSVKRLRILLVPDAMLKELK